MHICPIPMRQPLAIKIKPLRRLRATNTNKVEAYFKGFDLNRIMR
jgi:hypothetical protein